jgi:hypothetical protein
MTLILTVNGIPAFQYTVFDLFVLFWIDLLVLGMGMRERGWFGSIDTPVSGFQACSSLLSIKNAEVLQLL